ncbi:MAG TPA: mechanosensitive ion channel family protein [Candidatus Saccharimonadales bacterium]|nr:mechanosensitive ion channel family protein [Candidatus Saccharimonadales bacterium]
MVSSPINTVAKQTTNVVQQVAHNVFNIHSIIVLLLCLIVALIAGRFVAFLLRKVVNLISQHADKIEDLKTVNRLRRYETILVLSVAVIRTALIIFAIYFWWIFVHPNGHPTAIIGASAVAVVLISGTFSPVLRDVATGYFMMAEHWYGVGDHIRVEPFADLQGVVERVTLRSTRIRGLNGEIIWLSNQSIQGVRISPKGTNIIALELFVTDYSLGQQLVEETNRRLPIGPLLLVNPLQIVSSEKVGDQLWQITAVGETAPGREWLIEKSAVELIKWLDEQNQDQVIAHGPLARFADSDAERKFGRMILNAHKKPIKRKRTRNNGGANRTKAK